MGIYHQGVPLNLSRFPKALQGFQNKTHRSVIVDQYNFFGPQMPAPPKIKVGFWGALGTVLGTAAPFLLTKLGSSTKVQTTKAQGSGDNANIDKDVENLNKNYGAKGLKFANIGGTVSIATEDGQALKHGLSINEAQTYAASYSKTPAQTQTQATQGTPSATQISQTTESPTAGEVEPTVGTSQTAASTGTQGTAKTSSKVSVPQNWRKVNSSWYDKTYTSKNIQPENAKELLDKLLAERQKAYKVKVDEKQKEQLLKDFIKCNPSCFNKETGEVLGTFDPSKLDVPSNAALKDDYTATQTPKQETKPSTTTKLEQTPQEVIEWNKKNPRKQISYDGKNYKTTVTVMSTHDGPLKLEVSAKSFEELQTEVQKALEELNKQKNRADKTTAANYVNPGGFKI